MCQKISTFVSRTKKYMIIGRTHSADGGFRRIPIRHTQIVDKETRLVLVNYLQDRVYEKCKQGNWVGTRDIFPVLPDDILGTPLVIIYDICKDKFNNDSKAIVINLAKYLGILLREAVYYSDIKYYEQMLGSVRMYSLESKKLVEYNPFRNRELVINGRKK